MFRSFVSSGQIKTSFLPTKLIVEVDPELQRYYLNQIPKNLRPQKTRYPTHISVIRQDTTIAIGQFHDQWVDFVYEHEIYEDDKYFWLQVLCPRLKQIRAICGLSATQVGVTYSPDERHPFHITIANKINNGYHKL